MQSEPKSSDNRWPSQIKYIVGNEACERFSYYGMRSILAGYITGEVVRGGLAQSDDAATSIIAAFVAANYFMPLLGAWLSDKVIGRYHTILWVSLFYCAGHGVLACSDFAGGVHGKMLCLVIGLGLIAFGSGGIKPCVSAFMGDQFKPEQSHLLQKAYGAFYWSINLGSFFSFLVIPWIQKHHGYSPAFAVPGVLMAIATFVFWLGTKHYVRIPPARQTKTAGFIPIYLSACRNQRGAASGPLLNLMTTLGMPLIVMVALTIVAFTRNMTPAVRVIGWTGLGCVAVWYLLVLAVSIRGKFDPGDTFWQAARKRYSASEVAAARTVTPILFVFALVPIFWSLFDQTSSTWVLQGKLMSAFRFGKLAWVQPLLPHWNVISILFGVASLALLLFLLLLPPVNFAARFSKQGRFFLLGGSVLLSGLFAGLLNYFPNYEVGAEEMQAANAMFVMILIPILTGWVYPHMGRHAAPLRRMTYGMFVAALSYVVVAILQARIAGGAQLSVLWQTVPYIVLTTAEVLVSTTGLEFAFREASKELRSTIMSFWLLTVTVGDLLIASVTNLLTGAGHEAASVSSERFLLYAAAVFVGAILFMIVAKNYRYQDPIAAEGK